METIEDRVESLEGICTALCPKITDLENSGKRISKYEHVYQKLDELELSETAMFETDNLLESNRISCVLSNHYKKIGKTFKTMSHDKGIVIVRIK